MYYLLGRDHSEEWGSGIATIWLEVSFGANRSRNTLAHGNLSVYRTFAVLVAGAFFEEMVPV